MLYQYSTPPGEKCGLSGTAVGSVPNPHWTPTGLVAQVFTPFSVIADIGVLAEGTYRANARFYVGNVLEHSARDSFKVSAVPLPATIWLFASGLISLIGMAWRKGDSFIHG